MAPPSKPAVMTGPTKPSQNKSQPSNGVLTEPPAPVVNRKKQKRRQKQAAKAATNEKQEGTDASDDLDDGMLAPPGTYPQSAHHPPHPDLHYDEDYISQPPDLFEGTNGSEYGYSDDEPQYAYDPAYPANGASDQYTSGTGTAKKRPKKKKKNRSAQYDADYDEAFDLDSSRYPPVPGPAPLQRSPSGYPPPAISDEALRTVHQRVNDPIWDSSTLEERSNIRQFWISLAEDKRKELVRIEKEAVLRKMKEQQKHSCSCTVCGRKRTAIEEELEVLYDAYYEELKQFAGTSQPRSVHGAAASAPSTSRRIPPASSPLAPVGRSNKPQKGRVQELPDNAEDGVDEDEIDDYSDDPYQADEYSGDDSDAIPPGAEDILAFGRSLTVKAGGVLTVADELLRNDGRKFIDMMEKLAERRMRRESQAYAPYDNANPPMPPPQHTHPPPHEYSEEEEYDDEEGEEYESEEGEFDDEDEMDAMTEQQRMAEGRRMFQIFAARMFEQRVLNAYREMVARERQDRLIAEMEEESRADTQRDAKKARDAEKKKAKKQQQKLKQAEEKARKDEVKLAAEAQVREAEARKQAELQAKREEQRKKKEAERKAIEDEKLRKEAEKQRRVQEERQRQQDIEKKAREAKAEEKRRKDEAKRLEREEKEAQEQAARDKTAQEEKSRREREDKLRAEADNSEKQRKSQRSAQPVSATADAPRRPQLPAIVALPPGFKSQKSFTGLASPQAKVTTPVLPKPPTPVKPKDTSASASHVSEITPSETPQSSQKSTPPRVPTAPTLSQPTSAGSLRGRSRQPQTAFAPQVSPSHSGAPPPGIAHAATMPPMGVTPSLNGFSHAHGQAPMMHPQFQQYRPNQGQAPSMTMPNRPYPNHNGTYSQAPPAPMGMAGRGVTNARPTGFGPPLDAAPIGHPRSIQPAPREPIGRHSRHQSTNIDHPAQPQDVSTMPGVSTNPIARPAPIKRPDSVQPQEDGFGSVKGRPKELEDEPEHFGSSALLSDALDDVPSENRRPGASNSGPPLASASSLTSAFDHPGAGHFGSIRSGVDSWRPGGFGQPSMNAAPGWGSAAGSHVGSGWSHSNSFGGGTYPRAGSAPRPVTVRKLACDVLRHRPDKHMDITQLLHEVDKSRSPTEPGIQMNDLQGILDTEGDSHNGGGSFSISSHVPGRVLVVYTPDRAGTGGFGGLPGRGGSMQGLGEIGSPLPGMGFPTSIGGGGRH